MILMIPHWISCDVGDSGFDFSDFKISDRLLVILAIPAWIFVILMIPDWILFIFVISAWISCDVYDIGCDCCGFDDLGLDFL